MKGQTPDNRQVIGPTTENRTDERPESRQQGIDERPDIK
jgi:hypothetical protein